MNMISMNQINRCGALVDALRAELGGVLAERVFEAEAADFRVVDGEGAAVELLWKRSFDSSDEAEIAFLEAR